MWLSNLRPFEKISYNKNQLSVFSPFLFFNRQTFDRFMFVRFHRVQEQFQNSATSEPIITFLSTNRTWNIDGKKKGIKKWVGEISEKFEIKIRTRHIRVHTCTTCTFHSNIFGVVNSEQYARITPTSMHTTDTRICIRGYGEMEVERKKRTPDRKGGSTSKPLDIKTLKRKKPRSVILLKG